MRDSLDLNECVQRGKYFLQQKSKKDKIQRIRNCWAELQEVIPNLPVYTLPKFLFQRPIWQSGLFFVLLTLIIMEFNRLNLSIFVLMLIVIVSIISVDSGELLLRSQNKTLSKEHRGYLWSVFVMRMITIFLPLTLVVLFGVATHMDLTTFTGVIVLVVVCFIAERLTYFMIALPTRTIYRVWLAKANYEQADRINQRFLRVLPFFTNFVTTKSVIDLLHGNVDSALLYTRRALVLIQNGSPVHTANFVTTLATLESTDNENKLRLFEQALKIAPESATVYADLAEFYLDKRIQPERALEVTDAMMNFAPHKPPRPQLTLNYTWHVVLMVRAWALANVGRFEEANDLLNRVMDVMVDNFYPLNALIYTIAGNIKRLESQIEDAKGYYQRAVTLDPKGLNGRQAAQALSDLSSIAY